MQHSRIPAGLGIWLVLLIPATATAHDSHSSDGVVPDSEYATALELGLEGPGETKGIGAVERLGAVDLGEEFAGMEGRTFRARRLTIEPGGVVAVHRHQQRPGFAYILEGEIIEHRNDRDGPIVRRAGDVAVEKTGVAHWWENRSGAKVKALIVDIIPEQP